MSTSQASRAQRDRETASSFRHRNPKPARPKKPPKQIKSPLASGIAHHQQVAVDSLHRLFMAPAASLLTWAVIGIALALPLCLFLVLQNLQQLGSDLDEVTQISLFMEMGISDAQLEEGRESLLRRNDVTAVEIISSRQALEEFRLISGFADVLTGLDENPLPAVLVVSPGTATVEETEVLFAALQGLQGVNYAQLDLEWVQRLYSIIEIAQGMTLALAVLLGVGVILVVGNTVRLTIESRRSEIVVVKLVGGTDAYVSRPFLYTGLWYGVGGGIIAWFLVQLALLGLQGPVSGLAGLYNNSFTLVGIDISGTLLMLLGSGLLGWTGAWFSVLRHLREIEPN